MEERSREVTIHDIARELGINPSTVSRALNNNQSISEKTRDLVQGKAVSMGYQRNIMASNLRMQKSKTIGLLIPRIDRQFFSTAIAGVEERAYKMGYNVIICQTKDRYDREVKLTQSFFLNRVAGVICSVALETEQPDHFNQLLDKNIPLVFFDRYIEDVKAGHVVVNDFDAGYQMGKHLIEQGCKRIAHIGAPQHVIEYRLRFEGLMAAIKEAGLEIDPKYFSFQKDLTRETGKLGFEQIWANEVKPDGIFCGNDMMAFAIIKEAQKRGIDVPNDLAIGGISDEIFSEIMSPSITTIRQPAQEMGYHALKMLIDSIENDTVSESKVLPIELIVRESTQRSR